MPLPSRRRHSWLALHLPCKKQSGWSHEWKIQRSLHVEAPLDAQGHGMAAAQPCLQFKLPAQSTAPHHTPEHPPLPPHCACVRCIALPPQMHRHPFLRCTRAKPFLLSGIASIFWLPRHSPCLCCKFGGCNGLSKAVGVGGRRQWMKALDTLPWPAGNPFVQFDAGQQTQA